MAKLYAMYIVKCNPIYEVMGSSNNRVEISVDGEFYHEGTNVSFSCTPGLMLIGYNASTCMTNSLWEPDPREVKCIGEYTRFNVINNNYLLMHAAICDVPVLMNNSLITLVHNSTVEGSELLLQCVEFPDITATALCLGNGRWSNDVASFDCTLHNSDPNHGKHLILTGTCIQVLAINIGFHHLQFVIVVEAVKLMSLKMVMHLFS